MSVVGVRTREARVVRRRRHLLRGRAPLRDRLRGTDVIQHLHRPLIQDMRLGQIRRRLARTDQQMVHALASQEHRSGQTRTATTNDQDRNFLVDTQL